MTKLLRWVPRVLVALALVLVADLTLVRGDDQVEATRELLQQARNISHDSPARHLQVRPRNLPLADLPLPGVCVRPIARAAVPVRGRNPPIPPVAAWVAQHITVDLRTPAAFDASILAIRTATRAVESVTAGSGNVCYATKGWLITIITPGHKTTDIEMIDDLYIHINECVGNTNQQDIDKANAYGPKEMLLFNRMRLNCAIRDKDEQGADAEIDANNRCCVFFISEAVRFDWMRFRLRAILGLPQGLANNYGFQFDRKRTVNKWDDLQKRIGIPETEVRELLGAAGETTMWTKDTTVLPRHVQLELELPDYFEDNGDTVTVPDAE